MSDSEDGVFVNCPFDSGYTLFKAIVFTVTRSGFRVRCGLETDNGALNRFDRICKIIRECKFAIHDISPVLTSDNPPLPRFNMPLELGLFLAAKKFGGAKDRDKSCIIFDAEEFRYQRFISDISGQDVHSHENDEQTLIVKLAGWLRQLRPNSSVPGGREIYREYARYKELVPQFYAEQKLTEQEATFADYAGLTAAYVNTL